MATKPAEPAEPVDLERDGFAWREAGPRNAGTPIVLLHGLMGSRLSWEPQLADLGRRHRVVAWDLPGYGRSVPLAGEPSFQAFSDAAMAFCDVLGAPRVHLVGLSFGGMIAQYAAAAHGERVASLTLMATSPKFGLDGTSADAWRQQRLAALDAGEQPAASAPRVLRAIAGPALTDEALASQIAAAARVPADGLRHSIEVLVTHDSRHILPKITAPTVVLVGELDGETPVGYARAISELIPGAQLHIVPGAGHLLNVEAPAAVDRLILAHITASC